MSNWKRIGTFTIEGESIHYPYRFSVSEYVRTEDFNVIGSSEHIEVELYSIFEAFPEENQFWPDGRALNGTFKVVRDGHIGERYLAIRHGQVIPCRRVSHAQATSTGFDGVSGISGYTGTTGSGISSVGMPITIGSFVRCKSTGELFEVKGHVYCQWAENHCGLRSPNTCNNLLVSIRKGFERQSWCPLDLVRNFDCAGVNSEKFSKIIVPKPKRMIR